MSSFFPPYFHQTSGPFFRAFSQPPTFSSPAPTENAALPHGSGTDRTLARTDFALFDCTASLHGYYSDVTRVRTLSLESLVFLSPFFWWSLLAFSGSLAFQFYFYL